MSERSALISGDCIAFQRPAPGSGPPALCLEDVDRPVLGTAVTAIERSAKKPGPPQVGRSHLRRAVLQPAGGGRSRLNAMNNEPRPAILYIRRLGPWPSNGLLVDGRAGFNVVADPGTLACVAILSPSRRVPD